MHWRYFLTLCFFVMTLSAAHLIASEGRVWVSSFDAKLKADKTASSETIAVLELRTALVVIAKEERWYLVMAPDKKKGWIYRGKITTEEPRPNDESGDGDSVGKLLTEITGSRIESKDVDTSRSMRMLSVDKKKKTGEEQPDQDVEEALESVLSRRIPDVHVDRFLQAGKIGEYAP